MASADVENIRRDLLQWSAPVIADLLTDAYRAKLGTRQLSTQVLTSVHARLWRVLLQGDREAVEAARKELLSLVTISKLPRDVTDEIDEAVLEELLEIVTLRFTRSAGSTRDYTRLLINASANIARMRLLITA